MAVKLTKDEQDKLNSWAAEYLDEQWRDRGMPARVFQEYAWWANNVCESPIEQRMLAGLMFCAFGFYEEPNMILMLDDVSVGKIPPRDSAIIVPQAENSRCRVDFLIFLNTLDTKADMPALIVECDGHDFHERTKEQAARDRRRDRHFQSKGIPILRFTGSEIHNDLEACINEIDALGMKLLEEAWKSERAA